MTQISKRNEDLRVLRTRKLLESSMMELTIQRGFDSVTVKAICEHAMVNRATFYRHYADKYDLLDQHMDELYDLLEQSQGEKSRASEKLPLGLVQMLEHLRGRADFYRTMLGPKGYPPFSEKIRSYMEKRFRRFLSTHPAAPDSGHPPVDMMLRSMSSAGVGALIWWLEKGAAVTPEQMAGWAVDIGKVSFARR